MFQDNNHKIGVIGLFVGELYGLIYDLILSKNLYYKFWKFRVSLDDKGFDKKQHWIKEFL